jgi:hypothetical protein
MTLGLSAAATGVTAARTLRAEMNAIFMMSPF